MDLCFRGSHDARASQPHVADRHPGVSIESKKTETRREALKLLSRSDAGLPHRQQSLRDCLREIGQHHEGAPSYVLFASFRTTSTEHGAWRTTLCETPPNIMTLLSSVIPFDPTTMRSA